MPVAAGSVRGDIDVDRGVAAAAVGGRDGGNRAHVGDGAGERGVVGHDDAHHVANLDVGLQGGVKGDLDLAGQQGHRKRRLGPGATVAPRFGGDTCDPHGARLENDRAHRAAGRSATGPAPPGAAPRPLRSLR